MAAGTPTMSASPLDPAVSPAWVAAHLAEPDVRVVDATWYVPWLHRDAQREFREAHIPGAAYFDIDAIADRRTTLPHMLPDAESFAQSVGALGIGEGDRVIVYGGRHLVASARVWWAFRVFGYDRVAVLDGGFPRWRDEGLPLESGESTPAPRRFLARMRHELVADLDRVRQILEHRGEIVVDARSHGRFVGTEPEPRPGVRSGHIPGSLNLPSDRLFGPEGLLLPPEGLRRAFEAAGLDLDRPAVTACGSGVTAAVLAFGLYVLGREHAAVYDGSWTEWGGRTDTPVER
ncbi:MAG TPA: 3-mercaptopyruvate sulfurtransferase [bacterium]|nr:3-mercaptopyruvate sulfurtransferase [bacterium]